MSCEQPIRQFIAAAALLLAMFSGQPCCAAEKPRVAIDIGHSPAEKGALSARNRPEYYFNRKMAVAVARELKKNSRVSAIIINPEGEEISLHKRADLINEAKPDLLISIHHDSVHPGYLSDWIWRGAPANFCDKYFGYSVFVSGKNLRAKSSKSFAIALGRRLRKSGFLPSTHHLEQIEGEKREAVDASAGVFRFNGLVVLRETRCPAVLLECGIIRNRSEETLLRGSAYRQRMARTVSSAVSEFFGIRRK